MDKFLIFHFALITLLIAPLTTFGSVSQPQTNVCERETSVKDALERNLNKACGDITADDLNSLIELAINPAIPKPRTYQATDFEGLINLRHLFFYDNSQNFSEDTFDKLNSLEVLFIKPSVLPQGLFKNLKNLNSLSLVGGFTKLPSDIFDQLSKLKDLSVIGQLTTIPPHVFDRNSNLEVLNISWNKISSLPPGVFDQNTKLKILNIGRNQLSSFPKNLFAKLLELEALCLYFNPIVSKQNQRCRDRLVT